MKRISGTCGLLVVLSLLAAATYVAAGTPGWTVNPANYQYTGSVTSAVYRGIEDVGSAGDVLGAFFGEECRGVIEAWQTPGSNYIFLMTCYSNAASGESLSFRFYDSGMDVICRIDERVEFVADMIVGGIMSPMEMHIGNCGPFTPSSPVPCNLCEQDPVDSLYWNSGDADEGDSVVYYVYLGTEADPPIYDTTEVYAGSMTTVGYELQAPLAVHGIHHWKIVAEDRQGMLTAGPIWTFDNTPNAILPTPWGRIKMLFE
jgi:hypothetical protein